MSLHLYMRRIIYAPCLPQTKRKRNRVQFQQKKSHWGSLVGRGVTHDNGSPERAAGRFEQQIRRPSARNYINIS